MCLKIAFTPTELAQECLKIDIEKGYGWKVFELNCYDKKLRAQFKGCKPYRINRWETERNFRGFSLIMDATRQNTIKATDRIHIKSKDRKGRQTSLERYKKGFHIYITREEARTSMKKFYTKTKYVVRKVKYRKVVAIGLQGSEGRIIVAKEMLILPNKRRSK